MSLGTTPLCHQTMGINPCMPTLFCTAKQKSYLCMSSLCRRTVVEKNAPRWPIKKKGNKNLYQFPQKSFTCDLKKKSVFGRQIYALWWVFSWLLSSSISSACCCIDERGKNSQLKFVRITASDPQKGMYIYNSMCARKRDSLKTRTSCRGFLLIPYSKHPTVVLISLVTQAIPRPYRIRSCWAGSSGM